MRFRARRDDAIEIVALVRPPAVHAQIDKRLVERPVAARPAGQAAISHPAFCPTAAEQPCRHHSQRRSTFCLRAPRAEQREMIRMQLLDGLGGLGKCAGVPGELAVIGIPSVGAEAGARDRSWRRREASSRGRCAPPPGSRRERPACDAIADIQRPQRRHLRKAGDLGVFGQDVLRLIGCDDKHVDGKSSSRC